MERIGAGEEINTAKQQHTWENNHLVSIFISRHFSQSSTYIKPIPKDNRSSLTEVFCKKGVLRHFAKFTGKHLCQRFFLIKLQAKPETLLKKESLTQAKFAKFLRTPFLQNTYGDYFWDNFHTTTSAAKELTSVFEIQVIVKINMSQEGEGPHADDKESCVGSKSNFFIFLNFENLCLVMI